MMTASSLLPLPLLILLVAAGGASGVGVSVNLVTDHQTHTDYPLAVPTQPVLQWWVSRTDEDDHSFVNVVQDEYRVVVSQRSPATLDGLTDTVQDKIAWDSDTVMSAKQTVKVPIELPPGGRFYWTVSLVLSYTNVHNGTRYQTIVSAPQVASFDTDTNPNHVFLTSAWVGGYNQLRGDFDISYATRHSPLTYARAKLFSVGAAYLYVNGQPVNDNVMDPGQTVYDRRLMSVTYDITRFMTDKYNVVGLLLGSYKYGYLDTWCNVTEAGGRDQCRSAIVVVTVGYADGNTQTIGSHPRWSGRQSSIVYDHLWHGETQDARLELPGWASLPLSAFPEGVWNFLPYKYAKPGIEETSPQNFAPIRTSATLKAASVTEFYSQCPKGFIGGWARESDTLNLKCKEGTGNISQILIANYGRPSGSCPTFTPGSCSAEHALEKIESFCLGKTSCSIPVNNDFFGSDPCLDQIKSLAVVAQGCEQEPNVNNQSFVIDFGANVAGFCTLKGEFPRGTTITLRHAETLMMPNGHVNNIFYPSSAPGTDPCSMPLWYEGKWSECANQTDVFIFNGTGKESFTPKFTYHGFRYVEVEGVPVGFGQQAFELVAHRVNSALAERGTAVYVGSGPFSIQRARHLADVSRNTQLSQLWSIPTDCPQREKRGWMGDAHMTSDGLMYMFDSFNFHRSFLRSIRDDQLKGCINNPNDTRSQPCSDPDQSKGSVPDVVPFSTSPYGSFPGSPVWQSAFPVIAWNLWKHFGDKLVIEELYEGLVEFMDYLQRNADPNTGLVEFGHLGDWNPPGGNSNQKTPTQAVSAFYGIMNLKYMVDLAGAIGKAEDTQVYQRMLNASRVAYHNTFYNTTSKTYATGSQCALVMALASESVPQDFEDGVFEQLLTSIRNQNNHLDLGIVGMTHVFHVLSKFSRTDVALQILEQDTYPSFGHMLANGATTLWESWEGSAYNPVSSQNHIMYAGGFNPWYFGELGGLAPVTDGEHGGWQRIRMSFPPRLLEVLKGSNRQAVMTTVQTPYGKASFEWMGPTGGEDVMIIRAQFPPGTSGGLVLIPLIRPNAQVQCDEKIIWENGHFVAANPGITSGNLINRGGEQTLELEVANGFFRFYVSASPSAATMHDLKARLALARLKNSSAHTVN